MENGELSLSLDLHYYLENPEPGREHVMDAKIHNKCESEIIEALNDFASLFDDDITIGVSAIEDGGVIDKLKLFFKDKTTKFYFEKILKVIVSAFVKKDYRLSETEAQLNRLELIKKIKETALSDEEIDFVVKGNPKFISHKNVYYANISKEKHVSKINFLAYDEKLKENKHEGTILRQNFASQIEKNTTTTSATEYKGTSVLIYSPVLRKGSSAKWRGLFMNEDIKFLILDKLFLNQVYNKEVPFTTGTSLECDVKETITYKYDVNGNVVDKTREFVLDNITSWSESNIVQHRTKRYKKMQAEALQPSLFNDSDFN